MNNIDDTEAIAIDSNILTYYSEAVKLDYHPANDPEEVMPERVASLQVPLYSKWYAILPTVHAEYMKIKESGKLERHIAVEQVFLEYEQSAFDENKIKERAKYFNKYHKGEQNYNDCKIVAEAEYLKDTTVLLTIDGDLIKSISPLTEGLLIIKPTDFIERLKQKKLRLRISPSKNSHLYNETWWRL